MKYNSEDLNMESTQAIIDLDPSLKIVGQNSELKGFKKFWVVDKAKDQAETQISQQLDPNLKIINEFGYKKMKKEAITKKERKEIEKQLGTKIKKKLKISKNPCWTSYY